MLKRINKRGDKYYILISLILGIIVLSLSLYFIFQEYFTAETIDWESCRQSVYLRGTLPEANYAGLTLSSFKNKFPLKCKTQVVEITQGDIEKGNAGKIVAETLVSCWGIFGNGDLNLFPSKLFFKTSCVPCARIHLSADAKKYLQDNPSVNIDIKKALATNWRDGLTYKSYIEGVGLQFAPFNFAFARDFNLGSHHFYVENKSQISGILRNRDTGKTESGAKFSRIDLPGNINPEWGDLLINFGTLVSSSQNGVGAYIPYLFYFQIDQDVDPFEQVKKDMVVTSWIYPNIHVCDSWEGIPG